jgi:hypothetical protein
MNEAWVYSIGTFLYFIFHLTALILSLVFWRRHPTVCVLVLAGSLLNLLALGVRMVFPMIWFRLFEDRMTFAFINLSINLVNLSGSALYLIAIFTGRSRYAPRRAHFVPPEDDDWDRPAPPPAKTQSGSTGIQTHTP